MKDYTKPYGLKLALNRFLHGHSQLRIYVSFTKFRPVTGNQHQENGCYVVDQNVLPVPLIPVCKIKRIGRLVDISSHFFPNSESIQCKIIVYPYVHILRASKNSTRQNENFGVTLHFRVIVIPSRYYMLR